MYLIIVITYLIFISFILVMRFIDEPLARILRATSVPRNDFNKLIDRSIDRSID